MSIAVFALGAVVVAATLGSAVRTVVLPRGIPAKLTTFVFLAVRRLFSLRLHFARTYERRDRILASYAPLSLLLLPGAWLALILSGYAAMFWALGVRPVRDAVTMSGSSLLTLGFVPLPDLPTRALGFTEAAFGLAAVALLITYLPSLYSSFARRETLVAKLEVRASTPPSASEMLWRYTAIHGLDELDEMWASWETWFAEVEESHTTLPALVFFRSPQPEQSWVTAAGAVLDAASFVVSSVPSRGGPEELSGHTGTRHPGASLCIRAGFLALRRIAGYFGIPYPTDLAENDPTHVDRISVTRAEFDAMWDRLRAAGTPLVEDRDQAWRDFAGWRVNYDSVLLALASLTVAPPAPWSSDRAPKLGLPKLFRGRPGRRRSPATAPPRG